MAKSKRIEVIDDQLQLPEAIIQRIQTFLNGREAASTALLSKSWYNSWLTRPALDFDERNFGNQNSDPGSDDNFLNYVRKSMERYNQLNLNIESFKLWMNVNDIDSSSLATELIVKAVKMGANFINLEFNPPIFEYRLPKELFGSESLVGLFVVGCKILGGEVNCSRLRTLHLSRVFIEDDMISDIVLKCPLIENLFVSDCEGLGKVDVCNLSKLKKLTAVRHLTNPVVFRVPLIEFEEESVGSVVDNPIHVVTFCKLNCLLLERVRIDKELFHDFSSKFPCVEDLTVRYCKGCVKFDISSESLKYISLAHTKQLKIQLDVPNISKFKYSGSTIPSVSFLTASREWESDIALICWSYLNDSWFIKLKNFLTILSLSKINLGIELFREKGINFMLEIEDSPKPPTVENLILKVHSPALVCSDLLDGIFWSFRPKVINQCLIPAPYIENNEFMQPLYWKASNELLQLLCTKLMDSEISNCKMINTHVVEKVNAEFFEDIVKEWLPLPWKTLLDTLESPEKEVRVRFLLSWATPDNAGTSHVLCEGALEGANEVLNLQKNNDKFVWSL